MWRTFIGVALLIVAAGCAGVASDNVVSLGQRFTLAVGQTATVRGEGLELTFKDVLEDSRCPKNAVCIQMGKARIAVEAKKGGAVVDTTIEQPGLSDGSSEWTVHGYTVVFHLDPYPEAGKNTEKADYRLALTVTK